MSVIEAIILGIIQGLAEFLPISSSGHLALGSIVFGLEDTMLFHITVHIGTLIPIIIVFRKDLWELLRRPFQRKTWLLVVATIPIAFAGALFQSRVESAFASLTFLAIGFTITALVLLFSDKIKNNNKTDDGITFTDAGIIGAAQAVAIFPGISRSGATIAAALARGVNREAAARFSFLLYIPAMLGATALHAFDIITSDYPVYIDFAVHGIGFVTSAVTGYLAIRLLLAAVKRAKLRYFAYYVLGLAAAITIGVLIF